MVTGTRNGCIIAAHETVSCRALTGGPGLRGVSTQPDREGIEDGLPGTAVGSIRDFAIGDVHTRQRLIAHSDAEKYFSYQSLGPTTIGEAGTTRTMLDYIGTLRLRTITEGDRCFAEWSSGYDRPPGDANYWASWWATSLPAWLSSMREHPAS